MIRCCTVHGVDIIAGQKLAEVVINFAVFVAVFLIDAVLRPLTDISFYVTHGYVLHIAAAQEVALVAPAHVADAYAGHNDTVTWCGAAGISHHGRRDQVG